MEVEGRYRDDRAALGVEYRHLISRNIGDSSDVAIGSCTEETEVAPGKVSMEAPSKQRIITAKVTILALAVLFALEVVVRPLFSRSNAFSFREEYSLKNNPRPKVYPQQYLKSPHDPPDYPLYSLSDDTKRQYEQWHKLVRNLSQMELQPSNWIPAIDWSRHPRRRSDRFPTVDERVQYYMGKWYNTTIPMHGKEFEEATFIQRKTTREFGPFSDILVNLYNLNKGELYQCYQNKKELHVFSPYCRDYIDLAILLSPEESSANVLHYIGDGLPYVPIEIQKYPLFAKVRPLCHPDTIDFENKLCKQHERVEPIILPLNRKRHFGACSLVPENDVPWEQKVGKAVWRGQYGKTHDTLSHTNDIKYALVSGHLNSTLVDAKFSKHTKEAPLNMIGDYMDIKDQLGYKYIISIEGNDVSSGLKWMLLSQSVVLAPTFTWESWAMEGKLKPFVHYIPLNANMSNVEEMVQWAEMHPLETQLISERSTLFIYDLLFHHDAIEDEKIIMQEMAERFEQNFGDAKVRQNQVNIQWDKHVSDRSKRFPSVEERVKYAMGKWYNYDGVLSMKRSDIKKLSHEISEDGLFIASGQHLAACALANSTYSTNARRLCQASLPYFDERNTADLKSNSFNRLSQSEKGDRLRFAPESSWRHDGKRLKEAKRVLLDDSIKILCYGGCSQEENKDDLPYFASFRGKDETAILWPFGTDHDANLDLFDWIKTIDIPFEEKKSIAFVRGGKEYLQPSTLRSSNMLSSSIETRKDGLLSKFFLVNNDESQKKGRIKEMISYRYLLANENDDNLNTDFIWMLLSQSVIIMPVGLQKTSWLMEGFLEPYVHFVPVASDYSDIDERIRWCEEHLKEAKMISEHATLFAHDILLDMRSKKENEEVKFQVMERYAMLFG